ncbi:MAG: hypothetical protein GX594_14345, partial [Pirellulaceae bacterium]|nr:hypothetical protein [Pirellulaceae bacterium]
MQHFPFIFADNDLIGWLVLFFFIIVPAIGQLLAKLRAPQPPGGGRRPAKPPGEIVDEIEVFMRRVLGGEDVPERPPVEPQPRPVEQPVQAVVIEDEPRVGQLSKRAKGSFDSEKPAKPIAGPGKEAATAASHYNQNVHQSFDRQLGALDIAAMQAASPAEPAPLVAGQPPAESPPLFAAGLAVMLSNPASLAQAVVLSEIFQRPEDR